MTTIHVLGSSGFIGRAIQRATGDLSVHCWSHKQPNHENYFDLFDPSSWESLLSKKPKTVILLAWPGLPNYEDKTHISKNLPACIELIDRLIDAGMQRLIVSGTCYEYGIQNGLMIEDNLTYPLNCYATQKTPQGELSQINVPQMVLIGVGQEFSMCMVRVKIQNHCTITL